MYTGIGIDFGTLCTHVFAPVQTFYNSSNKDHSFDVLPAINHDGRSTESRVLENSGNILIGNSALGKAAMSRFKNSITNPESQQATELFIKRLLEMIERLDEGISNKGAQCVLSFHFKIFHSLSLTFYEFYSFFFFIIYK